MEENSNIWDTISFPKVRNIQSKSIASDLQSVIPEIPEDYDSWKEDIVDYLNVNNLNELHDYLLNWFNENPKTPKEWLQVTSIHTMSLLEKTKGSQFISVFVDSPIDNMWDDIRMNHREIGKLPKTYNIEEIQKVINDIKNN